MEVPLERSGTLILRVWVEGGQLDGLRVRILRTIGQHKAPPLAVSGVEDVHAVVQAWFDELLNTELLSTDE